MGNHFYGSYHWELSPVEYRIALLNALEIFCAGETNLFVEAISPSLLQRFRFWRMRSHYRTHLLADAVSPQPAIFHIALSSTNLQALRKIVMRDGLDQRSITHIKGYSRDRGLFWFHGFCDEGDQTLCCSRHVDEAIIERLESKLGVKAEKKLGELKSDREQKEELNRIFHALNQQQQYTSARGLEAP